MIPRAKKRPNPRKPQDVQSVPAQPFTFPAPIRGWVLNENLAMAQPGAARVLDNWVCTTTGARARGGRSRYATLGDPVKALFAYRSGTEINFAATATEIFDVSSIADPDTPPTADVTGLTSGDWSTVQFGTAGGDFLYAVNGADDAQLFDGASWVAVDGASTPAITGVTTSDLSHVWTYANRVWFVIKGTLTAAYLPVDQIGGAASTFPLAGVFAKGGTLLFGAKWSLDAGDGLDDKCVFVSTEGEVAIYEGTNPASAADWRLAGRYDLPRPLGKQAIVNAGGDLLIATEAGLIPISAAINTDLGAIETKAVSAPITPYWLDLVRLYPTGWTARKFSRAGYMVIAPPQGDLCLVVNLVTGAWSRFTGWDVACMEDFAGSGFFGGADGFVYQMEVGGSDDGGLYVASYIGQHDAMGSYGAEKTVRQMRTVFRSRAPFRAQITASADFSNDLPAPPSAIISTGVDVWGIGLWDVALWDAGEPYSVQALWEAIGVSGTFLAPVVQISFGSSVTPFVELVSIDAMYHVGALVA
jgi:hypothetical protein